MPALALILPGPVPALPFVLIKVFWFDLMAISRQAMEKEVAAAADPDEKLVQFLEQTKEARGGH